MDVVGGKKYSQLKRTALK